MALPFDIDGDMVAKLSDRQLRELVYRIARAALHDKSISVPDVLRAGGEQDAPDGGVDVMLDGVEAKTAVPFLRRRHAVVQSKASLMPSNKITKEMRPGNRLRPKIARVLRAGGAYLIVSSRENLAEPELDKRRATMKRALGKLKLPKRALVDFYDRGRVARFVNEYLGAVLWVRDALRTPIFGWTARGNWSRAMRQQALATDEAPRVLALGEDGAALTMAAGVEAVRVVLRQPGSVARLTGQSGTGKTRMAESVVEPREITFENVVYTDVGADQIPGPSEMLQRLIADGNRFVVVLDNCPAGVHKACAALVRDTQASLLTIEADVEGGSVSSGARFRLSPSSDEVVEDLLAGATSHLSRLVRARIAEFAGGNARIALILAEQFGETDDVIGLLETDDLFYRMLRQGRPADGELERAAEVCALFYSFGCEERGSLSREFTYIAGFAGIQPSTLFRHVAELQRRDLVQRRGDWRAVLPQAFAHRLATLALDNTPEAALRELAAAPVGPRLTRSFARRLGFLSESPVARAFAESWASALFVDVKAIDDGVAQLANYLAPLAELTVLDGLRRVVADGGALGQRESAKRWARLLWHLAYDVSTFENAVDLIIAFAIAERDANGPFRRALHQLFQLFGSGTHAPPEQRLRVVRRLLDSGGDRAELGAALVGSLLKTEHFRVPFAPSFGAAPRSYGYVLGHLRLPDVYAPTFALIAEYDGRGGANADALRRALATSLRTLARAGLWDGIEHTVDALLTSRPWPDGWHAAAEALRYEKTGRSRLRKLVARLAPSTVDEQIDAYFVTRDPFRAFRHIDATQKRRTLDRLAKRVLAERASRPRRFESLLKGSSTYHRREFGQLLAKRTRRPIGLWRDVRRALASVSAVERNVTLVCGLLDAWSKSRPAYAAALLDALRDDEDLRTEFAYLQTRDGLRDRDVRRLIAVANDDRVPLHDLVSVAYGTAANAVSSSVFVRLVRAVGARSVASALEMLQLRMITERERRISAAVRRAGRDLLAALVVDASLEEHDTPLAYVARGSLAGAAARPIARRLLDDMARAASTYNPWTHHLKAFAQALAALHPGEALCAFLEGSDLTDDDETEFAWNVRNLEPFAQCSDDAIVGWVGREPAARAPRAARAMSLIERDAERRLRFSALGARVLDAVAKGEAATLSALRWQVLRPIDGYGTHAQALAPALEFMASLMEDKRAAVRTWAAELANRLQRDLVNYARHAAAPQQRFEDD